MGELAHNGRDFGPGTFRPAAYRSNGSFRHTGVDRRRRQIGRPDTVTTTAATVTRHDAPDARGDFRGDQWRQSIDVRDFVQQNYTPYEGDASFLAGPTELTLAVWGKLEAMFPAERLRGIYDADTKTPSRINSHGPGYIDRDKELIVGVQTDAPLKRGFMPNGRLRMVQNGLAAYGYQLDPLVKHQLDAVHSRRSVP